MQAYDAFDVKYTSREITAWGGLAILKRMIDGMGLRQAIQSWDLPAPGSNRGYAPVQLVEQMIVSIWCGAARFVQTDITRLDRTLTRLFDWPRAAGHKAIVRLFQRFDQGDANRLQANSYSWLFDSLNLNPVTLDVDSAGVSKSRAQTKAITQRTTAGTVTIPSWRLSLTGAWLLTCGCVQALATQPTMHWHS